MASSTSSAPTNQQQQHNNNDGKKRNKKPSSFRDTDAQLTISNDLHENSCFPPHNLVGSFSAMYLGADHASVFQHHRQEDVCSSRRAAGVQHEVVVLTADACAPPGMTYKGDDTSYIESYYFYNTTSTILIEEQEKCMTPETTTIWRREKQGTTRDHYSTNRTSEKQQNATTLTPSYHHDVAVSNESTNSSSISTEMPSFSTKGGVKMPFPAKLFHMLEYIDLHEPDLAKIISWQPHGRCFRTLDVKKMEEIILPRFFKHNHYSSFRRQLNIWCFKRISQQGPDNDSYYHDLFLRSKLYLCHGMNRLPQNKRAAAVVERSRISLACKHKKGDEPRFSLFPALPPSSHSAPWSSSTSSLPITWGCDSKNKSRSTTYIKGGERDIANTAPPVTRLRVVSEIFTEVDTSPQTAGSNDSSGGGRGDMCDGDITMTYHEKGRGPGAVQENECLPLLSSRMVEADLTPICIYSPPMNSKDKKDLAEALAKIVL